jgi:hypothetical protein
MTRAWVMVGATGIEPVTPTMSMSQCPSQQHSLLPNQSVSGVTGPRLW